MNQVKYTDVYIENLEAYNQRYDLIVNQGGQGSSKTRSILQLLFTIWQRIPNFRITVASYALPHLKAGAISDMHIIFQEHGLNSFDYFRTGEHTFYNKNKSFIEFVGIEGNEAKATGPRRDILFVNEANKKITYQVFELMNARTHRCTFLDFNPSAPFWFHDKIQPNFNHKLIISTYLNNPWLPDRELRNLLSKRDRPGFENWWKVYGLGQLGQLEGAILTNWSFGEFDNSLPFGYGQDFGVKDPDALIKVAIDKSNRKIYLHEEIYKTGLSTDELGLIEKEITGNSLVIADSASPRTIKDLEKKGINIKPISKARITDDIKMMMDYEFVITPESINLANEFNNWIWIDKKGQIPLDDFNHGLDAARYYISHILRPGILKGHRLL
jgi:phage terminase large subunit